MEVKRRLYPQNSSEAIAANQSCLFSRCQLCGLLLDCSLWQKMRQTCPFYYIFVSCQVLVLARSMPQLAVFSSWPWALPTAERCIIVCRQIIEADFACVAIACLLRCIEPGTVCVLAEHVCVLAEHWSGQSNTISISV